MGIVVGIMGGSGDGKTTSNVVNPDGTVIFNKDGYQGMDPESHFIINFDRKSLPFPGGLWSAEKKNYVSTTDFEIVLKCIEGVSKSAKFKSIGFDTLNSYLTFREFNDRKKMTFDYK